MMSGDSRRLCDNGIAIYPNETLQSRGNLYRNLRRFVHSPHIDLLSIQASYSEC